MSRIEKPHLRVLDDALLEFARKLAEICADAKPDRSDSIEWSGDPDTRKFWDIVARSSNVAINTGVYEEWLSAFSDINKRRARACDD